MSNESSPTLRLHKFGWSLGHWGKSLILPSGEIHTWSLDEDDRTHTAVLQDLGCLVLDGRNCCLISPSGALAKSPVWEDGDHWDDDAQQQLYRLERNLRYDPEAYWTELGKALKLNGSRA